MSQRAKAVKNAVAKRKADLKPKREPTFKKYEHKYKDKVVDVFGESKNDDNLMFNAAPIIQKKDKSLKKKVDIRLFKTKKNT